MKRIFFPLAPIFFLAVISACTPYSELKKDWERSGATPFFRDYTQPRPQGEFWPSRPDEDFAEQMAKIKEMKEKWLKAVGAAEEKGVFYQPDPQLFKELAAASRDPSVAAQVLKRNFTLSELEILAWLRNPGITSAKKNWRSSLEAYSQVANLDEILRQYAAFTKELMTGIGPMVESESLEMKFPFPGILALKGEVVTAEVNASWEALEIARRTAITKIRQTYWNLLYISRAQEIIKEMLSLLERLERVVAAQYETGKASFQDLIRVRIERDKLQEELKTMVEEQGNLEVKILEILDLPPGTSLSQPQVQKPQVIVPPLANLYPLALAKKQELRQMKAMIGKMERMIEMAETMVYPPYSLGFSFFQNKAISQVGSRKMEDPFLTKSTASLGVGLPKMPWYGTNDAYLRETKQKLAALRADLKKMEAETIFMVREAWFRLDQAKREEALYNQRVVGLSQAALEVATRGYQTGMVGFAELIMAYTGWLNDKLAVERRISDLGVALAQLEEALGAAWKE